jgi:hypothetical protein
LAITPGLSTIITKQQLAKMSSPPPPPDNWNPSSIIIAPAIFFSLAVVLCSLRLHSRFLAHRLAIDDFFLALAMILAIVHFTCFSLTVKNGLGRHYQYLSKQHVSMQMIVSLPRGESYSWGTACVKFSLACMLMRIKSESAMWRRGLWAMSIFVLIVSIAASGIDWGQCRPIRALWDFSYPRSRCMPKSKFKIWIYISSGECGQGAFGRRWTTHD